MDYELFVYLFLFSTRPNGLVFRRVAAVQWHILFILKELPAGSDDRLKLSFNMIVNVYYLCVVGFVAFKLRDSKVWNLLFILSHRTLELLS